MDTALPQKFPFILDRNLAKANCTENHVCMSCGTVVLGMASLSYGRIFCLEFQKIDGTYQRYNHYFEFF